MEIELFSLVPLGGLAAIAMIALYFRSQGKFEYNQYLLDMASKARMVADSDERLKKKKLAKKAKIQQAIRENTELWRNAA